MRRPRRNSIDCVILDTAITGALYQAVSSAGSNAEICGLLAGEVTAQQCGVVTGICPLPNIAGRELGFAVDPDELLHQLEVIKNMGLAAIVFYHSHPGGSLSPSFQDLQIPWISELPSLILAIRSNRIVAQCYWDDGSQIGSIPVFTDIKVQIPERSDVPVCIHSV